MTLFFHEGSNGLECRFKARKSMLINENFTVMIYEDRLMLLEDRTNHPDAKYLLYKDSDRVPNFLQGQKWKDISGSKGRLMVDVSSEKSDRHFYHVLSDASYCWLVTRSVDNLAGSVFFVLKKLKGYRDTYTIQDTTWFFKDEFSVENIQKRSGDERGRKQIAILFPPKDVVL